LPNTDRKLPEAKVGDPVWIFANPIAGRGRGLKIAKRLEKRLQSDGFAPRVFLDRADQIPDDEITSGARAAIVIGGDGTLRTVADRLTSARTTPPPLLPIGLGTANLMVRHLELGWEDELLEVDVSAALKVGKVRDLDAARANGRLFLLMVGIGFDAHIVHELDRLRTGPIGWINYLQPAALALHAYEYRPLRVCVDGNEVWSGRRGLAFIGNIREYGTGFPVLPFARPDDGLLDICVLPCASRAELIQLFLNAITGEHVRADGAVYLKGRTARIESEGSVPVQIDGDPGGHTPVEVELLAGKVPFIVREKR
jgi:diacylglycerol kinase (ATP)